MISLPPRTVWSGEQLDIFRWFNESTGNLVVEALAGTGKTTTIKEAFCYCGESRILYAVFNKKNQREADAKIKDARVDVKTLHGLGFAFVKAVWSNARPDRDVEFDRVKQVLGADVARMQPDFAAQVERLVSKAKNVSINPTVAELTEIAVRYDVDVDSERSVEKAALKVLELSKQRDALGRISFDDMVWLPVAMGWVKKWYDMVVVDEAQDMNLPQLDMARGASKGRVVVVGDSRQAIYGFRGAVSDGMAMMKDVLKAEVLGLTVTYRCPRLVVAEAKQIVPGYTSAVGSPDGAVSRCDRNKMVADAKPGCAILSRLNAPLMPVALSFLRNRIPARIEGRDIGERVIGLVRSFKARSVPHLIERVEAWKEKQLARLAKMRNSEKKAEETEDLAKTIVCLAEGAKGIKDVEQTIHDLFQDTDENSKPAVVLSTVHKAKGLEWDQVFMLLETFRRGKGIEEDNIYYVAVTRAKRHLVFVGGAPGTTEAVAEAGATPEQPALPAIPVLANLGKPDSLDLLSGSVFHRRGNVIAHDGGEWLCTRIGDCNATFTCMTRVDKVMKVTNDEGEVVEKTIRRKMHRDVIHLANSCEPSFILRRLAKAEVDDFLSGKSARPDGDDQQQGEGNNMATKTKKSKVGRGSNKGRAELVHSMKADGVKKDEVFEKVHAKYPWTPRPFFNVIWDRKPRGAASKPAKGGGKAAGKPAKGSKKKSAALPARKPKPAAPTGNGAPVLPPREPVAAEPVPVEAGTAVPETN